MVTDVYANTNVTKKSGEDFLNNRYKAIGASQGSDLLVQMVKLSPCSSSIFVSGLPISVTNVSATVARVAA